MVLSLGVHAQGLRREPLTSDVKVSVSLCQNKYVFLQEHIHDYIHTHTHTPLVLLPAAPAAALPLKPNSGSTHRRGCRGGQGLPAFKNRGISLENSAAIR